ncbi:hypothetical protein [Aquimarina algiphila]|uniref:hypothetical protein n=1 Tax=Aquimarina algiphila TaxID=2047982 RepID=UPI002491437A|nr:hypothetical protein [Aquimarina algiphila]
MKIIFDEDDLKVTNAVNLSNSLLKNPEFYNKISEKESFDLSTATPKQISDLLKNSVLNFKVELFYPTGFYNRIKYRKTFAFTDHEFPDTLFLNKRKLNREEESIGATIIHECIHALDHDAVDYTFGHGNNSSKNKGNTAPYWIGNLAYKIFKNNYQVSEIVFDQIEE